MIETTHKHRRDRFKAAKAERLDNYMDDVVHKLEKLQKDEDDEDGVKYVKRKQELWDAQYIRTATTSQEPKSLSKRTTSSWRYWA